jgi:hypothetical protein
MVLSRTNPMNSKSPTAEYLERAKKLSPEETERLMARMRGRYRRRTEERKLSSIEALAFQLEHEDEELDEWRQRMRELREEEQKNKEAAARPLNAERRE